MRDIPLWSCALLPAGHGAVGDGGSSEQRPRVRGRRRRHWHHDVGLLGIHGAGGVFFFILTSLILTYC